MYFCVKARSMVVVMDEGDVMWVRCVEFHIIVEAVD